jgi:hypothetical protein
MKNKHIIIAGFFLIFSISSASACYFSFTLTDSDNNEEVVKPFDNIDINTGETYVLSITFCQDHRNCLVPADETDILLYEEKWKTTKDYLPMQLLNSSGWINTGAGSYTIDLEFIPKTEGLWELQILRECPKGGYDESLLFNIG